MSNDAGKIGAVRLQINPIVLKDRASTSRRGLGEKFIVLPSPNVQDND
jgi:hypothetical protein